MFNLQFAQHAEVLTGAKTTGENVASRARPSNLQRVHHGFCPSGGWDGQKTIAHQLKSAVVVSVKNELTPCHMNRR
jgi:hypothetical protein